MVTMMVFTIFANVNRRRVPFTSDLNKKVLKISVTLLFFDLKNNVNNKDV